MKTIITIMLAFIVSATFAKPIKRDTATAKKADSTVKYVKFLPGEVEALYGRTEEALKRLHHLSIDALQRDKIDSLIVGNQNFIKQRFLESNGTVPGTPPSIAPGFAKPDKKAKKTDAKKQ